MQEKKRITCMLIDDDIDDQELFAHALKHLDVSVDFVTANDGVHAIEKINSDSDFNPYFIFIDVNMPRMNGIECLVEIKKISKVKNTPVYLYSTYGDPDTISAGKKLGAVDLLVKAHSMKELEQTLAEIFQSEKTESGTDAE
ncbi:MAG TPA: response regulator [Flavobacterium sp.]|jgi:CheY-like chemotaxis protein